jgi:transposase-like protein
MNIQRQLGLGSYRTAWLWLHKLRRAMVCPDRDKLSGDVEVDEAMFGGVKEGKRGRGAEGKALVAIAVEVKEHKVGRVRMQIINAADALNLHRFIAENIERGSNLITDGWAGYNKIEAKGYSREISEHPKDNQSETLPHVHTVISLIKRWILGTLQGSCSKKQMEYYLDEFTFRFNRRKSRSRGLLFYRLMQNAVMHQPICYKDIVHIDEGIQNT